MVAPNTGQAARRTGHGGRGETGEIVPLNLALSYPVYWSRLKVLRDFVQNFFDSVGPEGFHQRFRWQRQGARLEVEVDAASFSHEWLIAIGASSKTATRGEYAGHFGEGFKIAALCASRDHGWQVSAGSRDWSIEVVLRDGDIDGHPMPMLAYRLHRHATTVDTSWLRLEGIAAGDEALLVDAVIPSFCYPENPLFGERVWGDETVEVWRRSRAPIPMSYPRSGQQRNARGILFHSRQAVGTHELPFVLAAHDVGPEDRERPVLYDFQVVDALASLAHRLPPAVAGEVLTTTRRWWTVPKPRKFTVGSWYPVVRALCDRLATDPEAAESWKGQHPGLVGAVPVRRGETATVNRRRQARSWLATHGHGMKLVQDGFLTLGYPQLENVCEQAGGFTMTRDPEAGWEKARTALLLDFVAQHFEGFFPIDKLPPLRIIKSSRATWSGMAVVHPRLPALASPSGHRLRYRLEEVAIKAQVLADDEPFDAVATFLHELAHMVGGDGSKRFAYVLTDLMARLGALHGELRFLQSTWKAVSPQDADGHH